MYYNSSLFQACQQTRKTVSTKPVCRFYIRRADPVFGIWGCVQSGNDNGAHLVPSNNDTCALNRDV